MQNDNIDNGNLFLGIVNGYDSQTQTASVTSVDGTSTYYNVGTMMQSCDYANGVFSGTPPSLNAACLCAKVGSEVLIIGQYAPANLGDAPTTDSSIGSYISRSPDLDAASSDALCGDSVQKNQSGAEVSLRGLMYSIKMNPIFYSVWNTINKVWDNVCDTFKLKTAALTLTSGNATTGSADTSFEFTTSAGGSTIVDLQIGNTADVIILKINGSNFCHINSGRHIILNADDIDITASNINLNAGTVKIAGGTLDCSGASAKYKSQHWDT